MSKLEKLQEYQFIKDKLSVEDKIDLKAKAKQWIFKISNYSFKELTPITLKNADYLRGAIDALIKFNSLEDDPQIKKLLSQNIDTIIPHSQDQGQTAPTNIKSDIIV